MERSILKLNVLFIILIGFAYSGYAQESKVNYNPKYPPNTYRNSDNPLYWKNKKPHEGYWQQDVHYQIEAELKDHANVIIGNEKLTYWNNSPDTLNEVYFHLYQNAFQPGSYYDKLHEANKIKPYYGLYERNQLGNSIHYFDVNGKIVLPDFDNTIMHVKLPDPIAPGENAVFTINFLTYFDIGSVRRRMKYWQHHGMKHFNTVHWYPRIAVYDEKFGWTTDQHLGREFYGDFGTYDVKLTLPQQYIVEATGNLVNKQEVLPDDLLGKIAISNFKDKPFGEAPSTIIEPSDSLLKTWYFHAENVHDFAWTADPSYRMEITEWEGVECVALVMEHKASKWQETSEFLADVIKTFSNDFGMYEYPKIVVADAEDGMEYPMVTLCGGVDPHNRYLIAHEVGHNWFFGMLGTNETYRAFMDEGFTQFLTAYGLDEIQGPLYSKGGGKNFYQKKFRYPITNRDRAVYLGYISDALKDKDPRLNTHSDHFNGKIRHGGGYGHVYYKTAAMLYNLQYVLGDELFMRAMKNYVRTWKIAHPYPEDFRQSIISYTGVDLNWFFDQWLESTESIDYKISQVSKRKDSMAISFKRKGDMQMPLDFSVIYKRGDTLNYHIPNTYFEKKTDAEVLDRWTGWDVLNENYTAVVPMKGKIKEIMIDPSYRLADVYMPDNYWKKGSVIKFDSRVSGNRPDRKKYEHFWRPDIWYNRVDGIKAGLHFHGNYLEYKHQYHLTTWLNTGLLSEYYENNAFEETEEIQSQDLINFNASYKTPLSCVNPDFYIDARGWLLDGLAGGYLGFQYELENTTLYSGVNIMQRARSGSDAYSMYPWSVQQWNNTLRYGINHRYKYFRGHGNINFDIANSAFASDFSFNRFSLEAVNTNFIKKFTVKTRFYAEYSFGNKLAPESALYLAGGRPEDAFQNKYYRSEAFFPEDWYNYDETIGNLHFGGGLNLRGYVGYLAPHTSANEQYLTYVGNTGASGSIEIEFDNFFRWKPKGLKDYFKLDLYAFADGGVINFNDFGYRIDLADPRADAGLGAVLSIKKFGPVEEVKPLKIRFDFPFYVSHAPYNEENFEFRWLIGIGRSF